MDQNNRPQFTNQNQFIHEFNKRYREKFNPNLFKRSDDEIIRYLENIIKSCERTMGVGSYFTIKINNFRIVDDYEEIISILQKYQENAIKKSIKLRNNTDNRYDFIDLKESDLKLLIVTYYIEAYDGREMFDVVIAVPRVIDKFYFKINGNIRTAMYQIVDASTYNNGTSNAKNPMVVSKTTFQPIRVYRNLVSLNDINGEEINMVTYDASIFKHSVEMSKYIFAKMGLIKGLQFLGLDGVFMINTHPIDDPNYYTFLPKKTSQIYVHVPKYMLENNLVVQHVTHTICTEFTRKYAVMPFIFSREYWLDALGRHFNLATPRDKGISVLTSLEFIYDITTQEELRLPDNEKKDIYCIFRWILYEFNALCRKNNLDSTIKRLRCEEYIPSLYAPKLSKAIYSLSDMGEKVDIKSIKKKITTDPLFLITEITKSSLVNFMDMVSDNDSYVALKYTYKGISGIGESGSNAIPDVYKYIHPSNLGIVDLDSSSPSDPGVSGCLVPLLELYDNNYFTDFKEPCMWRENLFRQLDQYRQIVGHKQAVEFRNMILDDSNVKELPLRSGEEYKKEMEILFNKPSKE